MNNFFRILISSCLLAFALPSIAQVPHGGAPLWTTPGTNMGNPAWQVHRMPGIDLDALRAADTVTDQVKSAPWRFGQEFPVDITLSDGTWLNIEGTAVWRTQIQAPGALAISLSFAEFNVPKGAKLFVWSADRTEYIGGFDHRNMKTWGGLATGLVAGEAVVVELHVPEGMEDAVGLRIDQVGHASRDIAGKAALASETLGTQRGPFGNSGNCNINVNCPEGATWQCEKRSVALIIQGGFAVYTGGEFNDSDLEQFCTSAMSVEEGQPIQVRIWPNPATNSVQLDGLPQQATIQSFDALGRAISAPFSASSSKHTIDVSDLPRGWVVFRVTSVDATYAVRCLLR